MHLATQNLPTLVVSTDPAHSLSDALMQDISGGLPVPLAGTELPIWGMEVDPEQAREELRELARDDGASEAYDMMRAVGLGSFADQLQVCPLFDPSLPSRSMFCLSFLCHLGDSFGRQNPRLEQGRLARFAGVYALSSLPTCLWSACLVTCKVS